MTNNCNYEVESIADMSRNDNLKQGEKILIKNTGQIFVYRGKGVYTDINYKKKFCKSDKYCSI
jgi:hypothetical protein